MYGDSSGCHNWEGVLLTTGGWRLGTLLNTVMGKKVPPQTTIQPRSAPMARLRKGALNKSENKSLHTLGSLQGLKGMKDACVIPSPCSPDHTRQRRRERERAGLVG